MENSKPTTDIQPIDIIDELDQSIIEKLYEFSEPEFNEFFKELRQTLFDFIGDEVE